LYSQPGPFEPEAGPQQPLTPRNLTLNSPKVEATTPAGPWLHLWILSFWAWAPGGRCVSMRAFHWSKFGGNPLGIKEVMGCGLPHCLHTLNPKVGQTL
jgi:hypothetical protein